MACYDHGNVNPYSNQFMHINHPNVPYYAEIPFLTVGKQIMITGSVPHHSQKFVIDLSNSHGIAFHQSIRFDENCVVRNHCQHDSWGSEERHGHMPFYRGQPFEIIISVTASNFRVAVNGAQIYDFAHRATHQNINSLGIYGEVKLDQVMVSAAGHRNPLTSQVINPHVPVLTPIVEGAYPGRLIQIHGRLNHHSKRFYFNLQNGTDENNILFHASIRFDEPNPSNPIVVRNNCSYGQWGREERHGPHCPFVLGRPFEILLLLEESEWKMAVNGQHFISFAHREAFQRATHLLIRGDVEITSIRQF